MVPYSHQIRGGFSNLFTLLLSRQWVRQHLVSGQSGSFGSFSHRIEKAKVAEMNWFLETLDVGLPRIKEKLSLMHDPARYISRRGTLQGFEQLPIESPEWSSGERDFITHGLSTVGQLPSPAQSVAPHEISVEASQPRRLGMNGIRRTRLPSVLN